MWTYAGSAQAFAFYGRLGVRERQQLLRVLDEMTRRPPEGLRSELRDDTGRDLLIWRAEGFELLFWADHAARELRIVEIELAGQ
jgi:hypothetical protein